MSTPAPTRPDGLAPLAQKLMHVLYQHRLLTAEQLTRLLRPTAANTQYTRRRLLQLQAHGLADATSRLHNRAGEQLWYITPLGADIVEAGRELPQRAYRITDQAAASILQEHTLAINETALAFVEHARRRGDECEPLSWEMEVAHRVRDGNTRTADEVWLTPDAVLHYTHTTDSGERMLLDFFIEVDRSTMNVARLAAKLHAYARYAAYIPQPAPGTRHRTGALVQEAWRERYRVFPRLLLVLTGAPPHILATRALDLRALAAADPRLHRAAAQLRAGITSLELLTRHGPFADVVTPLLGPDTPTTVLLPAPEVSA
jgi:hypothetical protein